MQHPVLEWRLPGRNPDGTFHRRGYPPVRRVTGRKEDVAPRLFELCIENSAVLPRIISTMNGQSILFRLLHWFMRRISGLWVRAVNGKIVRISAALHQALCDESSWTMRGRNMPQSDPALFRRLIWVKCFSFRAEPRTDHKHRRGIVSPCSEEHAPKPCG